MTEFNIDKTNLGLKAACIKNNIDITELKKKIEEAASGSGE